MNLIFTTVWNEARQCMIVVSEFASVVGKSAKSSGKKINRALFGRNKLVTALSAGIANLSTSLLFAGGLPEGSSLTYGQGQVTQSGNEMTITQSSDKMAIDWNSFNIGQGNKVTFVQPSSSQNKADKSSASVSDKKENIPTEDSWSKLSGIIPIRVVKGGIKQPEFEEDFQEVRRYGNGR